MSKLVFAANWKMHLGPGQAREFMAEFLARSGPRRDRELWFFPSAIAVETVASSTAHRSDILIGAQNVYWEPKGAFTGELSVAMAKEAGATGALVGHSERRHVFGESIEETALKLRALVEAEMTPVLCVGEKIEEREAGATIPVVERQLEALEGLDVATIERIPIAYEPVWAIGTGKTATPRDAAEVHNAIRSWLVAKGVAPDSVRILYGGSVKTDNVSSLVSDPEIDGVLVGGASLDPVSWAEIVNADAD